MFLLTKAFWPTSPSVAEITRTVEPTGASS